MGILGYFSQISTERICIHIYIQILAVLICERWSSIPVASAIQIQKKESENLVIGKLKAYIEVNIVLFNKWVYFINFPLSKNSSL